MQADIGRAAVQAVIFGDRDPKRRHIRCAVGRGMGIELHRQAQMVERPPGHAKVSDGNKPAAKVRKTARRLTGKRAQARAV